MEQLIRFALSNFTLTLFVIGLLAAAIALLDKPRPWSRTIVAEAFLAWFLLFSIGISNVYNFVVHVFFGATAAAFIGWADSPFQAEVGFASLGFAVLGFMAFRGSFDMRLAALAAPACFLWGAAVGHVVQMVTAHDFAPGNAGVIFWSDILLPVAGFVLLWMRSRAGQDHPAPASTLNTARDGA